MSTAFIAYGQGGSIMTEQELRQIAAAKDMSVRELYSKVKGEPEPSGADECMVKMGEAIVTTAKIIGSIGSWTFGRGRVLGDTITNKHLKVVGDLKKYYNGGKPMTTIQWIRWGTEEQDQLEMLKEGGGVNIPPHLQKKVSEELLEKLEAWGVPCNVRSEKALIKELLDDIGQEETE